MEENLTLKHNTRVAEYMGAVAEQWYPASEAYNQSGVHYAYPQNGPYPDNKRHHADTALRYHKSWEWQVPVFAKLMTELRTVTWKQKDTMNRVVYADHLGEYLDILQLNDAALGLGHLVKMINWKEHLKEKLNCNL